MENVLDIAGAYLIYNKETIIYALKVPRSKNAAYTMNFIEPVISNKPRVYLNSNHFLSGPALYILKEPCSKYRNVYICNSSQLEPLAEYIQQILEGESAQCPTERIYTSNIIRRIDDGNIFINDGEVMLASNCSSHQRELKGSFFIQFSSCMLKLNGEEYTNSIVKIVCSYHGRKGKLNSAHKPYSIRILTGSTFGVTSTHKSS